MLRASLALLLLVASAAVFAQNGRGIANGTTGTCQDVADRAVAERPADAVPNASDARRARATAVRSKYGAPASLTSPATTRGGGDDDDTPLPRSRGSKWHSFLPGMFR
ncbi:MULTISPECIES: hypothetical protein [Pseudoxanthomonas]|uniref:Secreted protein n=1 Tax=Pseudoxanthomonas japonensis TaxID=69284 RepID=A0ABQ6ZJJ5_9GAMM|nr:MULTISPECIES: hypothetical protein [Pseudoxanthomonas]KAF1726273.1 hypothetical protein CSC78_06375 [Pseudoxanthomonas japonensis]MCR6626326.1 hypothetical protein [Pseudoxanthomonas sp.]PZQ21484.1 MAG: hypothetical protein DI562_20610 [Stenotrophomonas acidaminiphila]